MDAQRHFKKLLLFFCSVLNEKDEPTELYSSLECKVCIHKKNTFYVSIHYIIHGIWVNLRIVIKDITMHDVRINIVIYTVQTGIKKHAVNSDVFMP